MGSSGRSPKFVRWARGRSRGEGSPHPRMATILPTPRERCVCLPRSCVHVGASPDVRASFLHRRDGMPPMGRILGGSAEGGRNSGWGWIMTHPRPRAPPRRRRRRRRLNQLLERGRAAISARDRIFLGDFVAVDSVFERNFNAAAADFDAGEHCDASDARANIV